MASSTGEIPSIQIAAAPKIIRSPSRDSITTDLSLFSVSSYTTDKLPVRLPSPRRAKSIPELMLEEQLEGELIRSCGALSEALGLSKSFSTSDITRLGTLSTSPYVGAGELKRSTSEVALLELPQGRLDHASRSCSTWVAVGDVASSSQLPSPTGRPGGRSTDTSGFTAIDLIRSVNKKVRQNYLRKKLMSTYKALERLSQSEFNLDKIVSVSGPLLNVIKPPSIDRNNVTLTVKDVERERGKPLSRYERNMMIFNWLQNLDETSNDTLTVPKE